MISKYYDGIVRFNFKELCCKNLGSEDYLNLSKICSHLFIDEIPHFDESISNQQLRFITLIDIIYEKKIKLTVSTASNLKSLRSSKIHFEVYKRTLSRLHELTL